MTTLDQDQVLLKPDQVARMLQVTPRTVRRWGATGLLTRVHLGDRLTRYTTESVQAFIEGRAERFECNVCGSLDVTPIGIDD